MTAAKSKPNNPAPVSQNVDAVALSCRRCAEFLSILCVISIAAIWILNIRIGAHVKANWETYSEFSRIGQMVGRLRAYEAKGGDYYCAVLYSCAQTIYGSTTYEILGEGEPWATISPIDGSIGVGGASHRADNEAAREFTTIAPKFGAMAATIMSNEGGSEAHEQSLQKAADALTTKGAVRDFLYEVGIPEILWLNKGGWNEACVWIINGRRYGYNDDPMPDPPGTNIAYRGRLQKGEDPKDALLVANIAAVGSSGNARAVLLAAWSEAYDRLRALTDAEPEIGVIGTGLSVAASDLLVVVSPGLIAFQVLFLVLWKERMVRLSKTRAADLPFDFPSYASPLDPLSRPWPRGLHNWAMRGAWGIFLVMPVLIALFGAVARYDFRSFEAVDVGDSWRAHKAAPFWPVLNLEHWDYSGMSVALDYFHLAAWLLSFVVLLNVIQDSLAPPRSRTWNWIAAILCVLVAGAFVLRWEALQTIAAQQPPGMTGILVTMERPFSATVQRLYVPAVTIGMTCAILLAFRARSRTGILLGITIFGAWCSITIR